jgi:NAD-dependent dihydropyrimidine dehydrogenase PreA subunit
LAIKRIIRKICESCPLRVGVGCPVQESCHTDAIRLGEEGFPYIAYPDDCDCCFLCQLDCPNGAVEVSARMALPLLAKY